MEFNAAAALNVAAKEIAKYADSVMFCLSKGLCSPVGSMLAGTNKFISKARKNRKLMGGGLRQAGYLAALGLISIEKMAYFFTLISTVSVDLIFLILSIPFSPVIFPITVTELAALGCVPSPAGVGPKNMQKALPGGQKAIFPISMSSFPFSRSASMGILKYTSFPHKLISDLMGRIFKIFFAVFESFIVASITISLNAISMILPNLSLSANNKYFL